MTRRMSFADGDDLVSVRGEVESLRIVGADFFAVATVLRAQGDGERFTAVGRLFGVKPGSTVELRGRWTMHPRHGRQLRVVDVEVLLAQDVAGVVRWLADCLPGVGRARATALVERFGVPGIWTTIETEPARLAEVPGISPTSAQLIVDAYATHRADRERMVWFKALGLTESQVARILQRWDKDAERVLRENPYALSEEVFGFGFKRADEIARRMGLPLDAPARLRAGLQHTLGAARQQGHVYLRAGKLVGMTAGVDCLGGIEERLVYAQLQALVANGRLVRHGADDDVGRWRVYIAALDEAEATVARFVRSAA